jgi:methyl-accepting chemotaxis protein
MLFLAGIAALIGIYGTVKLTDSNNRLDAMAHIIAKRVNNSANARAAFLDIVRIQKNIILERDTANIPTWEAKQTEQDAIFRSEMEEWGKVASEQGKQDIAIIAPAYEQWIAMNREIVAAKKKGQTVRAIEMTSAAAKQFYDPIEGNLKKSQHRAITQMDEQVVENQRSYATTRGTMLGLIVVCMAVSLAAGGFVVRSVTHRIHEVSGYIHDVAEGEGDLTKRIVITNRDELAVLGGHFNRFMDNLQQIISQVAASTEQIASASEQISASSTQIAQAATTQKEQTEQVTTAMQEMSSTVLQVSDNSAHAAQSAQHSGDLARSGGKVVEEMIGVIRGLAESTRETAGKIEQLGNSSDQIGKIVGVIDDIADQTNLLALNAAIEAARAGDQGRGFAVVADEVRKLAERTTTATKEIASMIETIQKETDKAVQAMEQGTARVDSGVNTAQTAGTALSDIINGSENVQKVVTHIATAATQQAAATEQVKDNMEHIANMVQQSATSAEESARACGQLSDLALELQQLVGRFKVGESRHDSRRSVTRPNASAHSARHIVAATVPTFTERVQ